MKRFAASLAVLVAAGAASADEIFLVDGGRMTGKAQRLGDEVIVTTPHSEVRLKADKVKTIVVGRTVWDDYADKLKAAEAKGDAKDAAAQVMLGDWCKEHDLAAEAKKHWNLALTLDTDHADARARLGFIRYDERWMTDDEYHKARGFLKVGSDWITVEESRRRDAEKLQREAQKKHERTIRDAVVKMASMKRKTRADAKVALQEYAESIGDLRLGSFASEVADFYNAEWRGVRRSLVQVEVRATLATLKRPIPTFTTSLGAFSTPVTIQLPEMSVVSVRTTALLPADIELDEDP